MNGWDIDFKIKKYWDIRDRNLPQSFLEEIEKSFKGFQDVSQEHPGSPAEFLSHLNLNFAEKFLRSLYTDDPRYPPIAIVKAFFLMDIKKMKFYPQLKRYLVNHLDEAVKLGFPVKNGEIWIPSSKTLWHFDRIRIGNHWEDFFRLLSNNCTQEGKTIGLKIGEKDIEDATPIEALQKDVEAKYNEHYKKKGYKLDTITDLESGIPLSKKVIDIIDDEAKCMIPHMKEIIKDNVNIKENWVDGGYDDYPNLAWAGVHKISIHHPIHENWIRNPKGEDENLHELYQEYWRDPDFRSNANIEYILSFLFNKGEVESVGAYFRNQAMDRAEKNPKRYNDNYHLRNRQEGRHGYWKEHLELESRMRVKGKIKVNQYLTRNLCSILSVALCRLQHGIKKNLTSIVYFT